MRLLLHIGFATTLMGAVWGIVFTVKGRRLEEAKNVWHFLSVQMLMPVLGGLMLFLFGWWFSMVSTRSLVLTTQSASVTAQYLPELQLLEAQLIPILILLVGSLYWLWRIRKDRQRTWFEFESFYVTIFLALLLFLVMPIILWEFSFALERILYTSILALGFGTMVTFTFLFFVNRHRAERLPFFYEILYPMCKVVAVSLAGYMILFLILSQGLIYLYPAFLLMQILFSVLVILTAWISGPLLDTGVAAHAAYPEHRVTHPERVIWTYVLFGVYGSTWLGFLATNFLNLEAYAFQELAAYFLIFLGSTLAVITLVSPIIFSKFRLNSPHENGKMLVHGTKR